ncbi:type II secretion system F family protein [Deltaproteobacteria bacterium IMCC39524]|nr:type II secretion system F family protein [Deltaproteobacteria bacterium IMCC39524]
MQLLKNTYYALLENADYYGIFLLMFLAVFFMILAISLLIRGRQSGTEGRLRKLVGEGTPSKSGKAASRLMGHNDESLAAKLSKPLHRIASIDKRSVRQKMQLTLVRAGFRSDQAIYNYLTAKILCPIIYALIFMFSRMVYNFQTEVLLSILMLLILGFFTPNLWVFLMTKTRQEKLVKGLPDALDLMVVCVESGLGLDMTFKRVGDEMLPLCKELSDEFTLTTMEVRAGISRADAFKNMNVRTGVSQIISLTTLLAQTSRFGTSLATALRVHADSMRIKRRQIAEATAAKSAVKMVFPLVLFIFPAIFVVLVGPGAIQIIKYLIPALGGR